MVSFEIVDGREQLVRYYAEWEALFASRRCEPSLSVEWTNALLDSHLLDCRVTSVILKDSVGLAGLVPLYTKTTQKAGLSLSNLLPVSEHFNTHSDILLRDTSHDFISVLLEALSRLNLKWDVFRLNRIPQQHPLIASLEQVLTHSAGYKYHVVESNPSFFVRLGDRYDDYLQQVSKSVRHKLRQAPQKLNAMGSMNICLLRNARDFDRAFDIIAGIENRSWKKDSATGLTASEKQQDFYRQLFSTALRNNRLRLWIMYLKDAPVAYEVGLVKGDTYYSVHGSYDEAFKKRSLGTILFGKVIESLIHEGLKELDFFGDLFDWQQYWTNELRLHKSLVIYNRTFKGQLFYLYNSLRNNRNRRMEDRLAVRQSRTQYQKASDEIHNSI